MSHRAMSIAPTDRVTSPSGEPDPPSARRRALIASTIIGSAPTVSPINASTASFSARFMSCDVNPA